MMKNTNDPIEAIVLAGGLGTRLQSVVSDRPKPLAEVGGRPFLDLVLAGMRGLPGLRRVVLAIGYRAEQIEAHYRGRTDFGFEIAFSVEERPLGTGGAIRWAMRETLAAELVVANGDSFVELDWPAFIAFHRSSGAALSVALREVEDAGRYGRVALSEQDRITEFREKEDGGVPGWINAGVYAMRRSVLEPLAAGTPSSLERDVIPDMLRLGQPVSGFRSVGRFIDIGLPETYRAAPDYLKDFLGGNRDGE